MRTSVRARDTSQGASRCPGRWRTPRQWASLAAVTSSTRSRPVPVGAEVALAFAAGVLASVLVGVPLAATDSVLVAALLAPLWAAGVVALTHYRGIAYAVPAALAALV